MIKEKFSIYSITDSIFYVKGNIHWRAKRIYIYIFTQETWRGKYESLKEMMLL